MKSYYIYLATFFILAIPVRAQWIDDAATDAAIQRGIKATYNIEFDAAEKEFNSVIKSHPDHPAGHFLSAMVDWWRIMIDQKNTSKDDAFIARLDKVIDLCDARLDKNEKDAAALFFKGGALGFQGRLYAMRKDWVNTASAGKSALPVVNDAEELAPGNADIQLGTGIYNYYASILPKRYPALKPLMIFLPEGNKTKGLKALEKAAEKGKYAKYEAKFFLLQTYYGYENKPMVALEYARSLTAEFPDNPVFQRFLGRCYVAAGRSQAAAPVFADILQRCDEGKTGYNSYIEREAAYYAGFYALRQQQYNHAMKQLVRCDKLSRSLDKEGPSGYMIMANLRIGMVHDALKQRDNALKQYKKVLAMNNYADAHELAKKYKAEAYGNKIGAAGDIQEATLVK